MDGRPPPPPPPPPPRPPPPPPAVAADALVVNDNNNDSSRQTRMPTPPSVLRDASSGSRNARNGSVAFVDGVNDASNRPSSSSGGGGRNIASSSSSAARKATSMQLQRPAPITLNRVISSQFENEAETHIIAALEMEDNGGGAGRQQSYGGYGGTSGSRNELDNNSSAGGSRGLLGEGIEGMEDYSDDDDDDDVDDDNNNGQVGGRQRQQQQATPAATSNRSRTLSTDSFLRKVAAMQNELPQYQQWADESNASTEYSSSPVNGATTVASSATYTRMRGKGMMVADNDDGDGDNDKNDDPNSGGGDASRTATQLLAMHIRRETEAMYEGDDVFVEAAMQKVDVAKDGGGRAALPVVAAAANDDDGGGGESTTHNEDGERGAGERRTIEGGTGHGGGGPGAVPAAPAERNIMTDATETTDNMNLMVDRLRSLQQRRATFQLGGGSSISASISSGGGGGGGVGEDDMPESSGDRLIAALNSVDSSKDSSFYAKIHSEYTELIVPKIPQFQREISIVLFYVAIPFLVVASLLFYMFDNPMAGDTGTSISWWILFVGVRQPIIFEFTRMGEVFWVEIFALRSKLFNRAVGPYVSLAFIQSSGWPYIICFWAVLNFAFLYGNLQFHKHWLFWQEQMDLFNSNNPAGGVTEDETYFRFLLSCIFVGAVVSLKRLFLAIYLGRREVTHFSAELEMLMAKMILIGEVAHLARDIEHKRDVFASTPMYDPITESGKLVHFQEFLSLMRDEEGVSSPPPISERKTLEVPKVTPPNTVESNPTTHPGSQGVSPHKSPPRPMPERIHRSSSDAKGDKPELARGDSSSNVELVKLLSEWEEPELTKTKKSQATVRDLVIFKKTVNCMDDKYPFGRAFGHAKTREACVQSSQEVYDRLMLSVASASSSNASRIDRLMLSLNPDPELPFSIISVLAMDDNGKFKDAKIKSLIRLFRPDRQGVLSRLDFAKSIDTVYKQLRLLRASIGNSAQIDLAFEKIVNCFFYFFLAVCAVSILGFDLWANFIIPLNAFFLGLSFLFGAAASNYFEGLLLIFVRRPYDIGDRIATSDPSNDTDPNGSATWYVDKVTLFSTTVRFASTNEVATYSNGSLAVLRIINANRSPKACITIAIKFGLDTNFHKITVFRTAVENFINARPREWISMVAFRAARVEADFGYVEYKVVAQHRERWQNIGPILQSKADLSSFCLEVTKKLDMKYESPPMPVNLSENIGLRRILGEQSSGGVDDDVQAREEQRILSVDDLQEVADLFKIRTE